MNPQRERAIIEWDRAKNSFRYSAETGDPIGYLPVAEALRRCRQLDRDGFAAADAWFEKTITHRYPLALERIARAHSTVTLNPATILISLQNGYVHSAYMTKKGSELLKCGGTHGGLDHLDSNGILLSSFAPTPHTSANRVAALFYGFRGLRDYRAEEEGAEWVTAEVQALTRIARGPLDGSRGLFPPHKAFLRMWTPRFANLRPEAPVERPFAKFHRSPRPGFAEPIRMH